MGRSHLEDLDHDDHSRSRYPATKKRRGKGRDLLAEIPLTQQNGTAPEIQASPKVKTKPDSTVKEPRGLLKALAEAKDKAAQLAVIEEQESAWFDPKGSEELLAELKKMHVPEPEPTVVSAPKAPKPRAKRVKQDTVYKVPKAPSLDIQF